MNTPTPANLSPQETPTVKTVEPASLRVVLLADHPALIGYGPVLRRMAVGLLDEVGDLTLLCLGTSHLLKHVPTPPVRIIQEIRHTSHPISRGYHINREINIATPPLGLREKVQPQRKALRFAEILAPFKPTLLHAMSERQGRLAQHLSRLMNIPYVVSFLSQKKREMHFIDENCGKIMPCNSYLARQIRVHRPDLAGRIQLTPIGTHVNEQPCCFDHGDRPPQLFYSGPLNYRYGLPEMINALKKLRDAGHTFHATFSGEGPSVHDLRQQVNTLKLESHVHFVPPIQSMLSGSDAFKAVLQTVDIFIQPWPSSAWRPELLEAMSVGNAVVAVGGVENDLIIEQKTALTIPYHDDHALFEKLDFLLKNRTSARDLACQSQNYLRKHFLVSRMITRLTKAYRLARQLKTT